MLLSTARFGLIGSNLKSDYAISRSECELSDFLQVDRVFAKYKPDSVIHVGGNLHPSYASNHTKHSSIFLNNALSDINIVKACEKYGVKKLLLVSSASAYPDKNECPAKEDSLYYGSVATKHYGYGVSKRLTVDIAKIFQMSSDLKINVLILGNVYGPGEKISLDGTIVGQLIAKIVSAKKSGDDIRLKGNGSDCRNFTYVKDLADIFQHIIDADLNLEPMNVANSTINSIEEIAENLKTLLNFKGNITFAKYDEKSKSEKTLDVTNFCKKFPQFQFTNLKSGLSDMVTSLNLT
jgi:nucleoside-diphosphate-sugar epimerase